MDSESFGIQWMQLQHQSLKTSADSTSLIPQDNRGDDLMANVHSVHQYLRPDNDDAGGVVSKADIEQIAAENLIFMARDGQMVSEILTATTDEHGTVVVSASDNIDCGNVMQQVLINNLGQQTTIVQEDDRSMIAAEMAYSADYAETTPQLVTEEIITDDWVQHQGEERVEIPAEQIIGSNSQVLLDIEVPLPTVEDEYTSLRPYPCDFCSRRFRKKNSLMNHMVAHQNDRPHNCKLCGARFFRRSDLINHLKAHADSPEHEFEDLEFMNLSENEQQRSISVNHYYDQDWSVQPEAVIIPTKSNRKNVQKKLVPGVLSTANIVKTPITTSIATVRGRISRLQAKHERYNFIESDGELQAATATVKFSQDLQVEQSRYPILDDSKPFVCQQCGLAFAREKALFSHMKNHRNDSSFECNQCNEMFWDMYNLQEHQKTHQFEESNSEYDPGEADDTQTDDESETEELYGDFYCSECGMAFHRQDLLRRHAKTHTSRSVDGDDNTSVDTKGRPCCNTCGETFDGPLDLLAHAEIHARFPPFKCVLCGESFCDEQTIQKHLQCQHANDMTPNSCILCGKECRDRKALIKHAWDHSREKCHSCPKCGKNFHNKARLKRHMSSHRDKSVICDVCQEEFPDGRSLSNHRHSHSASATGKLFPCNECGKTFGSRSSQQIHVRIHTGERPYGCRFCWKAFADGGTLRKHERIHTGEKPYACAVCPRAFNQRVVLREHIRSHHSGLDVKRGTYYCAVCSTDLKSSGELMQHLIQHSDTNTAKQRQPVAGPRKYKRRRKLKPHEIARMRNTNKQNGNDSDIDISDFDIVDDLLNVGIDNSTRTAISKNVSTSTTPQKSHKRNAKMKSKNMNNNNYKVNAAGGSNCNEMPEDKHKLTTMPLNGHNHNSANNNANKVWQTKLINSNLNEALFSNVENTLQSIDSLVVGTCESDTIANHGNEALKRKTNESVTQRSQKSKVVKNEPKLTSAAARTRKKPAQVCKPAGPRMIHTRKCGMLSEKIDNKRRTGQSFGASTETTNLDLLAKSTTLVDDYEIMSPDAQPPNQISSSPPPGNRIKQEPHPPHIHHTLSSSQESCTSRSGSDLDDAQLLLDASTLRKEMLEKFNPSIVNDLEEILRSPLKMGKNERSRFISESSTQFLVEQSEEEQHFIKIEPTSPDLREIVAGTLGHGSSVAIDNGVQSSSRGRRSARTSRMNRKYLEFETELNGGNASGLSSQKQNCSKGIKDIAPSAKQLCQANSVTPSTATVDSFMSYDINNYTIATSSVVHAVPTNTSPADIDVTIFTPIIASECNANGTESNVSNSIPQQDRKKDQYFECEMCSAIFRDRAQLLDHVPIHI